MIGGACVPAYQLQGPLNLTGGEGERRLSVITAGGRAGQQWGDAHKIGGSLHPNLGNSNPIYLKDSFIGGFI